MCVVSCSCAIQALIFLCVFISQEDDVQQARNLIQECYVYYQTMKLSNDCNKKKCRVPVDCEQNNAVYNILHFLIDVGSVKENVCESLY